jgi:hypothetical protein
MRYIRRQCTANLYSIKSSKSSLGLAVTIPECEDDTMSLSARTRLPTARTRNPLVQKFLMFHLLGRHTEPIAVHKYPCRNEDTTRFNVSSIAMSSKKVSGLQPYRNQSLVSHAPLAPRLLIVALPSGKSSSLPICAHAHHPLESEMGHSTPSHASRPDEAPYIQTTRAWTFESA